jgi:hypothetical protein
MVMMQMDLTRRAGASVKVKLERSDCNADGFGNQRANRYYSCRPYILTVWKGRFEVTVPEYSVVTALSKTRADVQSGSE